MTNARKHTSPVLTYYQPGLLPNKLIALPFHTFWYRCRNKVSAFMQDYLNSYRQFEKHNAPVTSVELLCDSVEMDFIESEYRQLLYK